MLKRFFGNRKGQLAIEMPTTPKIKSAASERQSLRRDVYSSLMIPIVAFGIFLWVWSMAAKGINTSLGKLPGPVQVGVQAQALWREHLAESAKRKEFYEKQVLQNAQKLAEDPQAKVKIRKYTGKPT